MPPESVSPNSVKPVDAISPIQPVENKAQQAEAKIMTPEGNLLSVSPAMLTPSESAKKAGAAFASVSFPATTPTKALETTYETLRTLELQIANSEWVITSAVAAFPNATDAAIQREFSGKLKISEKAATVVISELDGLKKTVFDNVQLQPLVKAKLMASIENFKQQGHVLQQRCALALDIPNGINALAAVYQGNQDETLKAFKEVFSNDPGLKKDCALEVLNRIDQDKDVKDIIQLELSKHNIIKPDVNEKKIEGFIKEFTNDSKLKINIDKDTINHAFNAAFKKTFPLASPTVADYTDDDLTKLGQAIAKKVGHRIEERIDIRSTSIANLRRKNADAGTVAAFEKIIAQQPGSTQIISTYDELTIVKNHLVKATETCLEALKLTRGNPALSKQKAIFDAKYGSLAQASREVERQKEQLFGQELEKQGMPIKNLFGRIQRLVGRDYALSSDWKFALLSTCQINTKDFDGMKALQNFLKEAEKVKLNKLEQIKEGKPLTVGKTIGDLFFSSLITPISSLSSSLNEAQDIPQEFVDKRIAELDHARARLNESQMFFMAKTGDFINTQSITDAITTAPGLKADATTKLAGDEAKDSKEKGRSSREIANLAAQELRSEHLIGDEQKYSKSKYMPWEGYNLWRHNDWKVSEPGSPLKIEWIGDFAYKKNDGSFSEVRKRATFDLTKLGNFPPDAEREMRALAASFASQWAAAPKGGDTRTALEHKDTPGFQIPKDYQPLFSHLKDENSKAAAYKELIAAADRFANEVESGVYAAFMEETPSSRLQQSIERSVLPSLTELKKISRYESLRTSSLAGRINASQSLPARIKSLIRFIWNFFTVSTRVIDKYAEAVALVENKIATENKLAKSSNKKQESLSIEEKREFLDWLALYEQTVQLKNDSKTNDSKYGDNEPNDLQAKSQKLNTLDKKSAFYTYSQILLEQEGLNHVKAQPEEVLVESAGENKASIPEEPSPEPKDAERPPPAAENQTIIPNTSKTVKFRWHAGSAPSLSKAAQPQATAAGTMDAATAISKEEDLDLTESKLAAAAQERKPAVTGTAITQVTIPTATHSPLPPIIEMGMNISK